MRSRLLVIGSAGMRPGVTVSALFRSQVGVCGRTRFMVEQKLPQLSSRRQLRIALPPCTVLKAVGAHQELPTTGAGRKHQIHTAKRSFRLCSQSDLSSDPERPVWPRYSRKAADRLQSRNGHSNGCLADLRTDWSWPRVRKQFQTAKRP